MKSKKIFDNIENAPWVMINPKAASKLYGLEKGKYTKDWINQHWFFGKDTFNKGIWVTDRIKTYNGIGIVNEDGTIIINEVTMIEAILNKIKIFFYCIKMTIIFRKIITWNTIINGRWSKN